MDIAELKEAVNKSDMTTKAKAEIIETLKLYVDTTELLKAKNDIIQALAKAHMRIPLIYYAAAVYGLGSAVIGIFSAIPLAVICGIGVFLIALVGILEVVFARRKVGDINGEANKHS